jgi:hypothetical protein
MQLDLCTVFAHMINVRQSSPVYFRNILSNVALNTLLVHCFFGAKSDLRQLIL